VSSIKCEVEEVLMMFLKIPPNYFFSETPIQFNHSRTCARHWGLCHLRLPAVAPPLSRFHRFLFLHTSHSSHPICPTTCQILAVVLHFHCSWTWRKCSKTTVSVLFGQLLFCLHLFSYVSDNQNCPLRRLPVHC